MQVSNEIIKVLDYLCEKVGVTIDWTNSNVLPYVEQLCTKYIKWEIVTSIAWLIIGIIGIIISAIVLRWCYKRYNTKCYLDDLEYILIACSLIAVFTCIILIGFEMFDIIECCAFPEKAIYDYIQTIIIYKL